MPTDDNATKDTEETPREEWRPPVGKNGEDPFSTTPNRRRR